jgi:hypothetical protein
MKDREKYVPQDMIESEVRDSVRKVGFVPWLAQLVVGLAIWRTGPDPRLVRVGFVMQKMALG